MQRIMGILGVVVVATMLVAGIAQAARPVQGTPAGQAWSTSSGGNPIPLAGTTEGGAIIPAVVTSLTLPADGKFVVHATVLVYNTDFANEVLVSCSLRHGIAPGGGTALDIAESRLPVANASGLGMTKLAFTGAVERVAAPPEVQVFVTCGATLPAGAQFGQLNAVSVSVLNVQ